METRKKRDGIVMMGLIASVFLGIYYVGQSARNIVFMDFWRNITLLIEPVMNGTLSINDVWYSSLGQRNPLQMLLVAVDIRFFNLNCLWESYAGIFVIAISTCIVFWNFKRQIQDVDTSWRYRGCQLLFLPVMLALFSLNQWEILSLQFSFAFMLRVCSYVLEMSIINSILNGHRQDKICFLWAGIYFGIIILLLSQLYWAALLGINLIVWLHWIITRRDTDIVQKTVLFWLPVACSIFLYFYKLDFAGGSNVFFSWIKNGKAFVAILYMFAASIWPQSKLEIMTKTTICTIGGAFLLIILLAIFLYFKCGMHKKTYFPIMLVGYGLLSIPVIVYGRSCFGDVFYMTASRYVVETTLVWVGALMIFAQVAIDFKDEKKDIWKKGSLIALVSFMAICFMYTDYTELKIAPYRGHGKEALFPVIINIDEYGDDDLIGLQQGDINMVRTGVALMKKYSLNVFHDNERYD